MQLDAAVKDLKKGKSPGPDGLSSEFYKEFFPQIKKTLLDALNYVYCNNAVNEKFVEGVITLIHKKDEMEKIENYRPITLLNIDYKILNKILNNRIKPYLRNIIYDHQHAQPGLSTHSATISIRDIFYEAQRTNVETFLITIDFKKAFDSIDHGWLQNVLRQKGFPVTFINYIDSIQRNGFSFIKTNHGLTTKFPIQKGVRQGDPLSLTLFTIALNPLINTIQKNSNIFVSPNPTKNAPKVIAYADDLTLTISKRISIQYVKEILNKYHKASGLQVNEKKQLG